jgi:malate dehydrogenase (oxaloacetate-decarboxylating)(NADP+)
MFYAAARSLASGVSQSSLDSGLLYPRLREIRQVSATIAEAVAEVAYSEGLARVPRPADLGAEVRRHMYDATYPRYA